MPKVGAHKLEIRCTLIFTFTLDFLFRQVYSKALHFGHPWICESSSPQYYFLHLAFQHCYCAIFLKICSKNAITFHLCRGTYEYEKKFYNDHLESLQVMEKNYITMATEVEKLRAELMNAPNVDRRAGILTISFLLPFWSSFFHFCILLMYHICKHKQMDLMVVQLETVRMRLLDVLWDKMLMKMVMVFPRSVLFLDLVLCKLLLYHHSWLLILDKIRIAKFCFLE